MKSIYIHKRWYIVLLGIVVVFLASYLWMPLFYIGLVLFIAFLLISFIDIYLLFNKQVAVRITRKTPDVYHLGEFNTVHLAIENLSRLHLIADIIEEIPHIFQVRDFHIQIDLPAQSIQQTHYDLKAIKRGEYLIDKTIIYLQTKLGFIQRRIDVEHNHVINVYPSTKMFKKFQLLAVSSQFALQGNRFIKKMGSSLEFDQIKDYNIGDDVRSVNWKATARKGNLMVNNYIEEKSQNIYNVIDCGRLMEYTFEGLTLMDYAVNASLALSKLTLLKDDKSGLILYNDTIKNFIAADKKPGQLHKINQTLYNLKTEFKDSSLEYLVSSVSRKINQRSLLIIYTNFESKTSFDRQLPYFKQLAKKHLLLVVFFENSQIKDFATKESNNLEEVFISTIAEKYIYEKKQIIKQLLNAGINSVMTNPQNLQTEVINEYLQMKKSQMI